VNQVPDPFLLVLHSLLTKFSIRYKRDILYTIGPLYLYIVMRLSIRWYLLLVALVVLVTMGKRKLISHQSVRYDNIPLYTLTEHMRVLLFSVPVNIAKKGAPPNPKPKKAVTVKPDDPESAEIIAKNGEHPNPKPKKAVTAKPVEPESAEIPTPDIPLKPEDVLENRAFDWDDRK